MGTYSTLIANILLFGVIILFILTGVRKKINVYDSFVEGAKEGFTTAVRIIPYLVAFLVGIAVFVLREQMVSCGWHWLCSRSVRSGYQFCGSIADSADEVSQR